MTDRVTGFSHCLLLAILIGLGGCQSATERQQEKVNLSVPACSDAHVPIGSIQGRSHASPRINELVTIRGVITRQLANARLYLQEPAAAADNDPLTSDAMLVSLSPATQLADAVAGSELIVTGLVGEKALQTGADTSTVTQLGQARASVCAHAQPLPLQVLDQTVDAASFEHMHVAVRDWQVAAAMRPSSRDSNSNENSMPAGSGTLMIASQHLYQPTQVVMPGRAAQRLAARNRAHLLQLVVAGFDAEQAWQMRAGDRLSVHGIVQPHADGAQLIALTNFRLGQTAVVEPAPQRQQDTIRVLGLNVQNLFNGDGRGNGFPTPRGAATAVEYQQQLQQLVDAIAELQPDLLALQELENDGYDRDSSIQQLKQALIDRLQQPWAIVQPAQTSKNILGSDAIRVGLLYRQDVLTTAAAAETLSRAPFNQLSRVPLAQRFRSSAGSLSFLISVNHFKSKGGCPEPANPEPAKVSNANQNDGQACWNAARLESAKLLRQWLTDLQHTMPEDNVLIMGDLNAYRMEQPIQTLTRNDWIDLVSRFHSMPLYSYRYRGRIGTLDYALASPALLPRVANAWYWDVNADASARRQQRFQPGSRFSDHDPVVVDLKLF